MSASVLPAPAGRTALAVSSTGAPAHTFGSAGVAVTVGGGTTVTLTVVVASQP